MQVRSNDKLKLVCEKKGKRYFFVENKSLAGSSGMWVLLCSKDMGIFNV